MTNTTLTFDNKIAQEVLTMEEFLIFKTLHNKVKEAEEKKAKETASKQKMCDCVHCKLEKVIEELDQALNITTEEVTPELFEHFLTTLLKGSGIELEVVNMSKQQENTKQEKAEEKQTKKHEDILSELLPLIEALDFFKLASLIK